MIQSYLEHLSVSLNLEGGLHLFSFAFCLSVLVPESGIHLLHPLLFLFLLLLESELLRPVSANLVLVTLGENRPKILTLIPSKLSILNIILKAMHVHICLLLGLDVQWDGGPLGLWIDKPNEFSCYT